MHSNEPPPTVSELAKMIDHALLHPSMSDAEVGKGCQMARDYGVASACVKPYSIRQALEILQGSDVLVCAVIGFPHGNSTTGIKVIEAESACLAGAREIDMVVNVGKVKSTDWDYVSREIHLINQAVIAQGALLKVIFENDYLEDGEIVRLCEICKEAEVAYVKTSTGFGFVKGEDGRYGYRGATLRHLKLMRENVSNKVQIKAAGGIRTLDEVLAAREIGVTRIGASSTRAILDEAISRGFQGSLPNPYSGKMEAGAGY
ncbi:MAG: deoxyribose-phosphate aldolase [Oceanipulchritudo sp.]